MFEQPLSKELCSAKRSQELGTRQWSQGSDWLPPADSGDYELSCPFLCFVFMWMFWGHSFASQYC